LSSKETTPRNLPLLGIFNLFVIYVVWGSTFLAIRVAVREGAGWGPFWLGASRVLAAAALLFLINGLRGVRLRPTAAELKVLALSGVLLWVIGNGTVNWAEQRIDSGLTALIIGTTAIWVAVIEGLLDRKPPSLLLMSSLVTGFVGLVVLTSPLFVHGLSGAAPRRVSRICRLCTGDERASAQPDAGGLGRVGLSCGFRVAAGVYRIRQRPQDAAGRPGHDVQLCKPSDRRHPRSIDPLGAHNKSDSRRDALDRSRGLGRL